MAALDPLLLNSSNPWATTLEDLQALYDCPHTGAVTIRTSLLNGFSHDDKIHQYCYFDANSMGVGRGATNIEQDENMEDDASSSITFGHYYSQSTQNLPQLNVQNTSSLNTLGYSPIPLASYISTIKSIQEKARKDNRPQKPVIFSVTGSAMDVQQCYYKLVRGVYETVSTQSNWMMEINLSCPNIPSKPPPAYSRLELLSYLTAIQETTTNLPGVKLKIGIKTPPYTYQGQFDDLIGALLETTSNNKPCPVSFITATNTLGSCLVMDPMTTSTPALNSASGTGIGGLAGAALHPLALGNVRIIRTMLDSHPELQSIKIIGVGGVSDGAGYKRMLSAGASAVAVGTALGSYGVAIFEKIRREVGELDSLKREESTQDESNDLYGASQQTPTSYDGRSTTTKLQFLSDW